MKLTKKRQQILNLIQSSDTPINAKFLKSKVDFDLSTVYRALEFLEKNNYIFSFDFENEKYYFKEENANFFIEIESKCFKINLFWRKEVMLLNCTGNYGNILIK